MSTVLQVRYIRVRTGSGWQDPYDLDKPVVAILGPVDTGKSSLVDCIAFALGRDGIEFRGTVDAHLREVEIGLRVRSGSFILRRSRRTSSYVDVLDFDDQPVGQFPIKSLPGMPTISSWLLEQVDLDDLFSAARLPGGHTLDFADSLLSYCYLVQDDIDRHIIRPRREDPIRLVVLKFLLNLTTPEFEKLQTDIRDADHAIERHRRQAQTIQKFFSDAESTSLDAVRYELADLRAREILAAKRLDELRNDARAVTKFEEYEQRRINDARNMVGTCEDTLDRLKRQHSKALDALSASEQALAALTDLEDRSAGERRTLSLAYSAECPACEASLVDRAPLPGRCFVCRELLPGTKHHHERRILDATRAQAATEEQELRIAVSTAGSQAEKARTALAALRRDAESRDDGSVTPFVDVIAAASAELAEIRGRLASLARVHESHRRLADQFAEVRSMEVEQGERRRQALQLTDIESPDHVLDALNDLFSQIISGIQLPHATGHARLDPESFLPLVDEQTFRQRGGGARSAVSIAYSLALLTYSLGNEIARLPGLLIIDSPQKNFGSNKDDKGLAHRVYERFLDYMDVRRQIAGGKYSRPFQLIIVDNDIHVDIQRRIKVHHFDRDNGFIRNLRDPHDFGLKGTQPMLLSGSVDMGKI